MTRDLAPAAAYFRRALALEPGKDGADIVGRCDAAAFASGKTATDAASAARAISTANSREIDGNMLAMFLIGIGIGIGIGLVLVVGGVVPG